MVKKPLLASQMSRLDSLFKDGKRMMASKLTLKRAIEMAKKYPANYAYLAAIEVGASEVPVRNYLKQMGYIIAKPKKVAYKDILIATNIFTEQVGASMRTVNIEVLNRGKVELINILFANDLLRKLRLP